MHRLDSHIADIEPRIVAICDAIPKVEEASLQHSLVSYGWILLDSWVAWRTLRFLLRETIIDETVNKKWFNTPSSYSASQLMAVWKFTASSQEFIKKETGRDLANIINDTIQYKRNAAAHCSDTSRVQGADVLIIEDLYNCLSTVFCAYEMKAFFQRVIEILQTKDYHSFAFILPDGQCCDLESFVSSTNLYSDINFVFECENNENAYSLVCGSDGCIAGLRDSDRTHFYPVRDSLHEQYRFMKNKGFFVNVEQFVCTIVQIWNAALCKFRSDGTLIPLTAA